MSEVTCPRCSSPASSASMPGDWKTRTRSCVVHCFITASRTPFQNLAPDLPAFTLKIRLISAEKVASSGQSTGLSEVMLFSWITRPCDSASSFTISAELASAGVTKMRLDMRS